MALRCGHTKRQRLPKTKNTHMVALNLYLHATPLFFNLSCRLDLCCLVYCFISLKRFIIAKDKASKLIRLKDSIKIESTWLVPCAMITRK